MSDAEKSEGIQGERDRIDGFEAARASILPELLAIAPFDGWTRTSLERAASDAGVDPATLTAAFPSGIADAFRYWSDTLDGEMTAAMAAPEFAGLNIREKVAFAVRARLDALRSHKEAARRAAATSAETAPCVAIASSGTPASAALASLL